MFIWYHKLKLAALKVKFNFKIIICPGHTALDG